jgi:hypothetical protein
MYLSVHIYEGFIHIIIVAFHKIYFNYTVLSQLQIIFLSYLILIRHVSAVYYHYQALFFSGTIERREYVRTDSSLWPRGTLYPQNLSLTSLTSGGRSVGIVRLWTAATEFFIFPLFSVIPYIFVVAFSVNEQDISNYNFGSLMLFFWVYSIICNNVARNLIAHAYSNTDSWWTYGIIYSRCYFNLYT